MIAFESFLISLCLLMLGYGLKIKMTLAFFRIFFFRGTFFIWGHWAAFDALLPDRVPYKIPGTTFGLTKTIHFID